jgi:alpha-1,6-mannosyltransferase
MNIIISQTLRRENDSFLLVRAVLGLSNAIALIAFGKSVEKAFGSSAGIWFALFQASQFHINYYASRTLPNMFALIFSKFRPISLAHDAKLPL